MKYLILIIPFLFLILFLNAYAFEYEYEWKIHEDGSFEYQYKYDLYDGIDDSGISEDNAYKTCMNFGILDKRYGNEEDKKPYEYHYKDKKLKKSCTEGYKDGYN